MPPKRLAPKRTAPASSVARVGIGLVVLACVIVNTTQLDGGDDIGRMVSIWAGVIALGVSASGVGNLELRGFAYGILAAAPWLALLLMRATPGQGALNALLPLAIAILAIPCLVISMVFGWLAQKALREAKPKARP